MRSDNPTDPAGNQSATSGMTYGSGTGVKDALKYNPRCLTRDINLFWSQQTRTQDMENLLSCDNVDCLEKRADGWEIDRTKPQPLFHAAGHFAVGGLQNDPFASPGDPVFFLHHAAFDRLWSIWQAQDPKTRTYQVGGTRTPFNSTSFNPRFFPFFE
jgi:tyrosinase